MANQGENIVPSLDKGGALPKIVRVTAITLLAYGVAMFSFGVYLPILAYTTGRGLEIFIAVPVGILIGLVMILISFGLFKGGYAMLHREAYGTGVGIGATYVGFFPGVYFILTLAGMVPERMGGVETMKYLAMFIFLLLNIIFLYALSRADKLLRSKS